FGLGLRVLELASLKIRHVMNEDGSINYTVKLPRTKGDKHRDVYIPEPSKDKRIERALREYVAERKKYCDIKRLPFTLEQPLFLSRKGTAFTNRTLQKRFQTIYELAGIAGASSHSGRRTFATNLIENGVDIKAIQTLMGHSSIAMTAVYVDANPIRLRNVIANALYR